MLLAMASSSRPVELQVTGSLLRPGLRAVASTTDLRAMPFGTAASW
jgi:hypothetical protein